MGSNQIEPVEKATRYLLDRVHAFSQRRVDQRLPL